MSSAQQSPSRAAGSPLRQELIRDKARKVYFKRKREESLEYLEEHFTKCLAHLPFVTKQDLKQAEMQLGYSEKQFQPPHPGYHRNLLKNQHPLPARQKYQHLMFNVNKNLGKMRGDKEFPYMPQTLKKKPADAKVEDFRQQLIQQKQGSVYRSIQHSTLSQPYQDMQQPPIIQSETPKQRSNLINQKQRQSLPAIQRSQTGLQQQDSYGGKHKRSVQFQGQNESIQGLMSRNNESLHQTRSSAQLLHSRNQQLDINAAMNSLNPIYLS